MKTPTLDFETLTLKDAFDLAVLMEEEARDRYVELAGQLRMHQTPEAATFFERMASTEELHRAGLLAHRQLLFGDAPPGVTRAQVEGVEGPRVIDARINLTLYQALEVALKGEEKARDFFDHVLLTIRSSDVRALFTELRDEEAEHQRMLLEELSEEEAALRRLASNKHRTTG